MTARDSAGEIVARPPEQSPAAALPFEAHDGAATVSLGGAAREASVVDDSLGAVIRRLALPAVASNVLMTVFASVDAFWVGTRIGARGLAAVSTAVFWIWMVISRGGDGERRPNGRRGTSSRRAPSGASGAHRR